MNRTMAEFAAIKYFCLRQSLNDPHFHDVDVLMGSYYQNIPWEKASAIIPALSRVIDVFSNKPGAKLEKGDSLIMERYYRICRRAYLRKGEQRKESA